MSDDDARDLEADLRRTLADLQALSLEATAWVAVLADLNRIADALEAEADAMTRAMLLSLSQAAFEGKVRQRLAGADGRAALVIATKPTSALPVVGALSAVALIGVGYLLGGPSVALLAGGFALFIFGVALAGTHTTKDRVDRSRTPVAGPEAIEVAPRVVIDAIRRIEGLL
ncbi:MAG: hypothetical protein EXQ71_03600 [Acidimicrobiia bacterium]|nr:hypothetical protein [Acidimicrobiia bacterium]